jgi:hypothetical protein
MQHGLSSASHQRGCKVAVEWVRWYDAQGVAAFLRGDPRGRRPVEGLQPGGLIAVHGYPDPEWPDVRPAVDEHTGRHGWERERQTDYPGAFRAPPR